MKKRFRGPQIVGKLRQADKLLGQGKTVEQVCKEIEVTDATSTTFHPAIKLRKLTANKVYD